MKINTSPNRYAFTLLELIIVVVIVGVLAALALPRMYRMIEMSRSVEAINALTVLRDQIENCRQAHGGLNYDPINCVTLVGPDFVIKDSGMTLEGIFKSPNHHFDFNGSGVLGGSPFQWLIYVSRNSYENNNDPGSPDGLSCPWGSATSPGPESMIGICIDESSSTVKVSGSGWYSGL